MLGADPLGQVQLAGDLPARHPTVIGEVVAGHDRRRGADRLCRVAVTQQQQRGRAFPVVPVDHVDRPLLDAPSLPAPFGPAGRIGRRCRDSRRRPACSRSAGRKRSGSRPGAVGSRWPGPSAVGRWPCVRCPPRRKVGVPPPDRAAPARGIWAGRRRPRGPAGRARARARRRRPPNRPSWRTARTPRRPWQFAPRHASDR